MIKAVIADDEVLERKVYRLLINRYFPDMRVVGEAETGREAIELFEKFKPDIMLMDVRMPGINGIEAISEIRKKSPYTKFIIISAYNYFDYAKEALKTGVEDYLLKPVAKDEFVRVVGKVAIKVEEELESQKVELIMKEKLKSMEPVMEAEAIKCIVNGDASGFKQYAGLLDLSLGSGFVAVGSIAEQCRSNKDEHSMRLLEKKVHDCLKDGVSLLKPLLISCFTAKKITMVFPAQPEDSSLNLKEYCYRNMVLLRNEIRSRFNIKMHFGISEVFRDIAGIAGAYNQALSALNSIGSDGMDIASFKDIKSSAAGGYQYPYDLESQLLDKIRLGLMEQALEVFEVIFSKLRECFGESPDRLKLELLELHFALSRLACECEYQSKESRDIVSCKEKYFSVTSRDELLKVFQEDIRHLCGIFREARNIKNKSIIISAVEYLKKNYMKDITLEEVAAKVCVSPNYFSRMFRNECGKSFIDYLTYLRIEAAKDLILKTGKSMRDICWDVGYNDPNYFTKVFKKVTNLTPSEYRDKCSS